MPSALSPSLTRLADLYYQTKSVMFGDFQLSVHLDNSRLERSPYYLKYPAANTENAALLSELYELVGLMMAKLATTSQPPIQFKRIAAVPKGAVPLAKAMAQRFDDWPANLLVFTKYQQPGGQTIFELTQGEYNPGDDLLIVEDHTSGGRNKVLMLEAARRANLVVTDILTVIDRQQGGVARLATMGVRLQSLLTIEQLLQHGILHGYITNLMVAEVQAYTERNRF